MAKATGFKTTLKKSRDTKGTYVFKNDDADAPIPSLYIKKSAFEGEAPDTVTITVS